ncbi:hypothetical protein FACS1894170_00470 [Planctomycetales bacterium]|nr:hypothetical protein FACS1894170_00470 [Planctomycetales bacterium]
MHGNVFEWCSDRYSDDPTGSVTDPLGASSGWYRVFRSGSWDLYAGNCRSARRYSIATVYRSKSRGLRISLVPQDK